MLRFLLWPNMWPILKYIPCALEKNVHSATTELNVIYICNVHLHSYVIHFHFFPCWFSLWMFYLLFKVMYESHQNVVLLLSVFSLIVSQCLLCIFKCSWVHKHLIYYNFLEDWSFLLLLLFFLLLLFNYSWMPFLPIPLPHPRWTHLPPPSPPSPLVLSMCPL